MQDYYVGIQNALQMRGSTLNWNMSTYNRRPWNSPSNELIQVGNQYIVQKHYNCKGKGKFYILQFNKSSSPNLRMTHRMSSTPKLNKIVQKSNKKN
jgi:hypothetical protein